jgi:hypothetical protein
MKAIDGVWIDHEKAVVAVAREDDIRTRTVRSSVGPHPHWAGAQDGGGEKKYEERRTQELNRFYDDVIAQLDPLASLYVFGPGEAKLEFRKRLEHASRFAHVPVHVESSDRLTDAQIVAKVRELAENRGHH